MVCDIDCGSVDLSNFFYFYLLVLFPWCWRSMVLLFRYFSVVWICRIVFDSEDLLNFPMAVWICRSDDLVLIWC